MADYKVNDTRRQRLSEWCMGMSPSTRSSDVNDLVISGSILACGGGRGGGGVDVCVLGGGGGPPPKSPPPPKVCRHTIIDTLYYGTYLWGKGF